MKKLEKWLGTKTYMYPSGELATAERIKNDFPSGLYFTHVVETDENGQVCFAFQNLSAMRTHYNVDESLTEDEAIEFIEAKINEPQPIPEPTAEERIASAMEYQNLML
jgi:hypothetical protein